MRETDSERVEEERQLRDELERRAEREREHTPAPRLGLDGTGQELYERAGKPGWTPWAELPVEQRRAWAQCERFLAHKRGMAELPGALRFEMPESEPERHDRHIQAVEAAISRRLTDGGLRLSPAAHNEAWLRGTAEAVLAAAETGI